MRTRTFFLWVCSFLCCFTLNAQYNVLTSPSINKDGSVTFKLDMPNAQRVVLKGQFQKDSLLMSKNAEGIWSVTVNSIKPDIYPYIFVVDGISIADPGNMLIFPNESFKASLLEMPNPEALYTVNQVPHGKVHYCTYKSFILNQYRNVVIYTPAEYDYSPNKQYPVFYLVSGTTDTEETWFKVGRANTILDNLIARGQAKPMIVVMPYGYMNNGTPPPSSTQAADMYNTFNSELTLCLMPFIEKNFRTITDRDHRAIAGFSRGGGQSMFAALKNPDKFGWLGSFSAYLTPEVMEKNFPNLKEAANSLNMLWFGVGTSDFLYKDVVRNQQYFDEKGIRYEQVAHEGSHTWMHARFCLAETAKKLFKDNVESKEFSGMTIDASSLPGFTVYHPNNLKETVSKVGRLPIYVFGNGGCSHNSAYYLPLFSELVNNGYMVIAVGSKDEKTATAATDFATLGKDDNLLDAVNWICEQNVTPESEYYHTADCSHIALSGHSCGGAQAIAASYDTRITTTVILDAGMGNMEMAGASSKSLENLHSPIIYLIGGPDDVAYANAALDFKRINNIQVVSANFPVGHGGTYGQPDGGTMGKVALMWLDWKLKGKKEASRFFTDSKWRKQNYPQCVFESKGLDK